MTEASSNRQYPVPETIEFIWEETHGRGGRPTKTRGDPRFQGISSDRGRERPHRIGGAGG